MDTDLESLLFRLLAYSLVRHLDLRLDAADAVYFELLSERELVHAWLAAHPSATDLRRALAASALSALAPAASAPGPSPSAA